MTAAHDTVDPSELLHITIPAAIVLFGSLAVLAFWLWARKEEGLKALAKAAGMTYDPDGLYNLAVPAHSALHGPRL